MPSADQHRKKAHGNRRFLDSISVADHPDWATTVAFYTAVHLVEQLRAADGDGHSTDHDDRLTYVQLNHSEIHTAYYVLQNAALLARYGSNADFFRQFQAADVSTRLVGESLVQIERYVEQHAKKSSRPPGGPTKR